MRVRINTNRIWLYFLLLPVMKPGILIEGYFSSINDVYSLLRIIVFAIIFSRQIFMHKISLSHYTISLMLYEGWVFLSTIHTNPRGLSVWAGPALSVITITMIFDAYRDENLHDLIEVLGNILFIYFVINEISVILAVLASGSTDAGLGYFIPQLGACQYFLGMDNRFINYFFPGVVCNTVVARRKGKRYGFKSLCILIGGSVTLIWLWAVGGMVGMILLAFLMFASEKFIRGRYYNSYNLITLVIIINTVIITVCVSNPEPLMNLMNVLFNKGSNFMDRVTMWRGVITGVFVHHPFAGIGVQATKYLAYFMRYGHAHNQVMTTLYQGGVIGVILLWDSLYIGCRPLMKYSKENIAKIILSAIVVELFTNIADSTFDGFFVIIVCIANCYRVIRENHSLLFEEEDARIRAITI